MKNLQDTQTNSNLQKPRAFKIADLSAFSLIDDSEAAQIFGGRILRRRIGGSRPIIIIIGSGSQ